MRRCPQEDRRPACVFCSPFLALTELPVDRPRILGPSVVLALGKMFKAKEFARICEAPRGLGFLASWLSLNRATFLR